MLKINDTEVRGLITYLIKLEDNGFNLYLETNLDSNLCNMMANEIKTVTIGGSKEYKDIPVEEVLFLGKRSKKNITTYSARLVLDLYKDKIKLKPRNVKSNYIKIGENKYTFGTLIIEKNKVYINDRDCVNFGEKNVITDSTKFEIYNKDNLIMSSNIDKIYFNDIFTKNEVFSMNEVELKPINEKTEISFLGYDIDDDVHEYAIDNNNVTFVIKNNMFKHFKTCNYLNNKLQIKNINTNLIYYVDYKNIEKKIYIEKDDTYLMINIPI